MVKSARFYNCLFIVKENPTVQTLYSTHYWDHLLDKSMGFRKTFDCHIVHDSPVLGPTIT
uniref:Uncharacterized protein n=1 Tax=Romanomermis culicivorax TaxID=13658 RepID=A0A915JPN5_ROMCU